MVARRAQLDVADGRGVLVVGHRDLAEQLRVGGGPRVPQAAVLAGQEHAPARVPHGRGPDRCRKAGLLSHRGHARAAARRARLWATFVVVARTEAASRAARGRRVWSNGNGCSTGRPIGAGRREVQTVSSACGAHQKASRIPGSAGAASGGLITTVTPRPRHPSCFPRPPRCPPLHPAPAPRASCRRPTARQPHSRQPPGRAPRRASQPRRPFGSATRCRPASSPPRGRRPSGPARAAFRGPSGWWCAPPPRWVWPAGLGRGGCRGVRGPWGLTASSCSGSRPTAVLPRAPRAGPAGLGERVPHLQSGPQQEAQRVRRLALRPDAACTAALPPACAGCCCAPPLARPRDRAWPARRTPPRRPRSCDGEGRIIGGLGAMPGFGWWPIKAYRPCTALTEAGLDYTRCAPAAAAALASAASRLASAASRPPSSCARRARRLVPPGGARSPAGSPGCRRLAPPPPPPPCVQEGAGHQRGALWRRQPQPQLHQVSGDAAEDGRQGAGRGALGPPGRQQEGGCARSGASGAQCV
jgi:hypothetical protein